MNQTINWLLKAVSEFFYFNFLSGHFEAFLFQDDFTETSRVDDDTQVLLICWHHVREESRQVDVCRHFVPDEIRGLMGPHTHMLVIISAN